MRSLCRQVAPQPRPCARRSPQGGGTGTGTGTNGNGDGPGPGAGTAGNGNGSGWDRRMGGGTEDGDGQRRAAAPPAVAVRCPVSLQAVLRPSSPSGPRALCRSCEKPNAITPKNKLNTKEGEPGLSLVPAVGRNEFYPEQSRSVGNSVAARCLLPCGAPAPGSARLHPRGAPASRGSAGDPGLPAPRQGTRAPGRAECSPAGPAPPAQPPRHPAPAAAGRSSPGPSPPVALNFSVPSARNARLPQPQLSPLPGFPSTGAPTARPGPQPLRASSAMRTRGSGSPRGATPRSARPSGRSLTLSGRCAPLRTRAVFLSNVCANSGVHYGRGRGDGRQHLPLLAAQVRRAPRAPAEGPPWSPAHPQQRGPDPLP